VQNGSATIDCREYGTTSITRHWWGRVAYPLVLETWVGPTLTLFPLCSGFLPHKKVGAPIAGRASDLIIKKWRKKRAGKWVAEDRLRTALFGAIWLLPPSVALFGVANAYIDGTWGLVLCFAFLFITGIGVSFQRFHDREG